MLGQPRAVQRYTARVRDDEGPLAGRIVELASVYGRYGSPRITGMLRNEGWNVNHKRVERIWRREGLKVPMKQPKRECQKICARAVLSDIDEPFAEDDGELCFGLEPFTRRSFPRLGRMTENEI